MGRTLDDDLQLAKLTNTLAQLNKTFLTMIDDMFSIEKLLQQIMLNCDQF